jgi:tetratricopeptide (TPR) repeat protein
MYSEPTRPAHDDGAAPTRLFGAGLARYRAGDIAGARSAVERDLAGARVETVRQAQADAWVALGSLALVEGDPTRARRAAEMALDLADRREAVVPAVAMSIVARAHLLVADWGRADDAFQLAQQLAGEGGGPPWLIMALELWSSSPSAHDDPVEASEHRARLAADLHALGEHHLARHAEREAAWCLIGAGQHAWAQTLLSTVLRNETWLVECQLTRAALAAAEPNRDLAIDALRAVFHTLANAGAKVLAVQVCAELLSRRPVDARRVRALGRELAVHDRAARVAWRGRHRLRVELIGASAVFVDGVQVRFTTTQCEEAFFALCAQPTHSMNIETLGDLLWPCASADRMAQRLNTLVWQMRFGLGGAGERVRRHRNIIAIDLDADECVAGDVHDVVFRAVS